MTLNSVKINSSKCEHVRQLARQVRQRHVIHRQPDQRMQEVEECLQFEVYMQSALNYCTLVCTSIMVILYVIYIVW